MIADLNFLRLYLDLVYIKVIRYFMDLKVKKFDNSHNPEKVFHIALHEKNIAYS